MLGKEFQSVRYLEWGLEGEMRELCVGLPPWPPVEGASPGGPVQGPVQRAGARAEAFSQVCGWLSAS